MRAIDADKLVDEFDGAKIEKCDGKNIERYYDFMRGFNSGMKFMVNQIKKAPTIKTEEQNEE